MNEKLEQLVVDFAYNKRNADIFTKEAKKYSDELKSVMASEGLTECVFGGNKVTIREQSNDRLNEDALMTELGIMAANKVISEDDYNAIVKTKQYIDTEALENAVYNKIVKPEIVSACIEKKPSTAKIYLSRG